MAIEIGQKAPEFGLFNDAKKKVQLSDYLGKNIILHFFPQAFTGTCTEQLCTVRDDIGRYNTSNAVVMGISVDSVFTLAKYKEEQGLNFDLLSDFNKNVSADYDTLYAHWILEMEGVSKRSAFIIDKEGVIQYAEVLESAGDLPNFEAINNKLAQLDG